MFLVDIESSPTISGIVDLGTELDSFIAHQGGVEVILQENGHWFFRIRSTLLPELIMALYRMEQPPMTLTISY